MPFPLPLPRFNAPAMKTATAVAAVPALILPLSVIATDTPLLPLGVCVLGVAISVLAFCVGWLHRDADIEDETTARMHALLDAYEARRATLMPPGSDPNHVD